MLRKEESGKRGMTGMKEARLLFERAALSRRLKQANRRCPV